MKTKSIFTSKTAAVNFIATVATAAAYFYPPASEFVKAHALQIVWGLGAANVALRMITHQKVTLFSADQ